MAGRDKHELRKVQTRSTILKFLFTTSSLAPHLPPSEPQKKRPCSKNAARFHLLLSQKAMKQVKVVRRRGGGLGDGQQREILKYDPDDVGIRSCSLAKQAFLIGRPPTPLRSI